MKIYAYNLPSYIQPIINEKYKENVIFIYNTDNLKTLLKQEDEIICMWNDEQTLNIIKNIENTIYPNKEFLLDFAANRETMTKFLDIHSQFKAERDYIQVPYSMTIMTPKLTSSLRVVAKLGNDHKGQNKYLLYPGQNLMVNDSVIFEEFLEDAKSIRVLLIGSETFIVEFDNDPDNPKINEENWIKNLNAILTIRKDKNNFKPLIEDTINLSGILGYDYIAVDYVMNQNKAIALEINTFPGTTKDKFIREVATKYWVNKIENIFNKS